MAEIGILAEQYKQKNEQVFVSQSFQFEDPNEEWVELFKILDPEKIKQSYDISVTKKKISSVRFNDQAHLQVYDPSFVALSDTKVRVLEESDSSNSGSDRSVENSDESQASSGSGSASPSQLSGSSSSEDPNDDKLLQYKNETTAKRQRHSSLTAEILKEAKEIMKGTTAGDGPGFNV
jgi:hypothetical protein